MAKFTDAQLADMGLSRQTVPQHVAVIMDGNGRWAVSRGLPRSLGHRAGTDRLRGIIRLSSDIGIQALTLYAFSTENWKRPADEVGVLMGLLIEYFNKEIDELNANNVRIKALGDLSAMPTKPREAVENAMRRTAANTGLKLNIALNYGSRAEILRAANLAAEAVRVDGGTITEDLFASYLYTADSPELDLLIRTSGEQRISNFLLYQVSYAELMFVDDYWPDFSDEKYLACLRRFAARSRRFGGLYGGEGNA